MCTGRGIFIGCERALRDAMLWAWLQQIALLMLIELLNGQAISVYLRACLRIRVCASFSPKNRGQDKQIPLIWDVCISPNFSTVSLFFLSLIFCQLLSSSSSRAWPSSSQAHKSRSTEKDQTLPRRCLHLICTHNIAAAFTSFSLTVPAKQIAHFELWAIIVLWYIRVFVGQKREK